MPAVFIAQSTLEQWSDAGKVEIQETTLILVKEQRQVDLNPAVRITGVLGDDPDPHQLVGKVKTKDQLDEMAAEHYGDSVIHGDVAYQCVEGFMGDLTASRPIEPPGAAAPAPAPAPVAAAPAANAPAPVDTGNAAPTSDKPEELTDAEALSQLFLDTVR